MLYQLIGLHHNIWSTYNRQDPVNPSVALIVRDKAEDERCKGYAERNHDSPHTHVPRPLFLEEGLDNYCTTNGVRWRDEEGLKCAASSHRRVSRTLCTANVERQTADQGDDEDGSTAIAC